VTAERLAWLKPVLSRRMVICAFTGFTSGMPLYFLISLIPAWLRVEGVGLKEIGFFSLVQLPYVWKFVWAPLMDRYRPPFLGRRRGWMLITQVVLLLSLASVGFYQPSSDLQIIVWLSVLIAFFSATQDIVLDAYRRELLPELELGLGNSVHVQTYRISQLIPGALGLILADHFEWDIVFMVVGGFMLIGIALTLAVSEAIDKPQIPRSIGAAVVEPFKEYFKRRGVAAALLVLAFMFLYKLGDNMATALSTPFYIDLGFSLTDIGVVAKNAGLWPMIIGGILGGILMLKIGINRALWLFGLVQVVTILGFAVLSEVGANLMVLALVIALEYLGVGLGTAAFIAFIARETNPVYAATQLALLTALTAVPRTFANATTGLIVEAIGWTPFFLLCTALAVPGMLLLFWVAPFRGREEEGA
jgi:PAT family beta-lactamase induction signal transducer AmpG